MSAAIRLQDRDNKIEWREALRGFGLVFVEIMGMNGCKHGLTP